MRKSEDILKDLECCMITRLCVRCSYHDKKYKSHKSCSTALYKETAELLEAEKARTVIRSAGGFRIV